MEVKDGKLIIEEELGNDDIEMVREALRNNDINEIEVKNDNLSSGIVQLLLCSGAKISSESQIFRKITESVFVSS